MSWGRDVEAKEERKKKSKEEEEEEKEEEAEEEEEEEEKEEEGSPGVTQDGVGLFIDGLVQVGRFVVLFGKSMFGLLRGFALSDQTGR